MLTARPVIGRGGAAANEYRLAGREGWSGWGTEDITARTEKGHLPMGMNETHPVSFHLRQPLKVHTCPHLLSLSSW